MVMLRAYVLSTLACASAAAVVHCFADFTRDCGIIPTTMTSCEEVTVPAVQVSHPVQVATSATLPEPRAWIPPLDNAVAHRNREALWQTYTYLWR